MSTRVHLQLKMSLEDKTAIRRALSFGNVYRKAWSLLKERWKDFGKLWLATMGLSFAGIFACIILWASLVLIGSLMGTMKVIATILMVVVAIVAVLGLLLIGIVGSTAYLRVFLEDRSGKKFWWSILKSSLPIAPRYAWIGVLQWLVAAAGSLAFYFGQFILSIRCMYSPFLLIEENKSGLQALICSNEIVRGKGYRLFLVTYLPPLVAILIGFLAILILTAVLKSAAVFVLPILFIAVLLIAVPLMMCVHVVTYRELKTLPVLSDPNSKRTRIAFVVLAVLGIFSILISFTDFYPDFRSIPDQDKNQTIQSGTSD